VNAFDAFMSVAGHGPLMSDGETRLGVVLRSLFYVLSADQQATVLERMGWEQVRPGEWKRVEAREPAVADHTG
jgi:hypothetical protein